MKTTLQIPDQTKGKAKATAGGAWGRESGTPAIEEKLSQGRGLPGRPWLECAGELAHLHKETVRIQKIIDAEFGQIEYRAASPPKGLRRVAAADARPDSLGRP